MQISTESNLLFSSDSKLLCYTQNEEIIAVGEDSDKLLIISKHELKNHIKILTEKKDRTLSLKLKDNLLIRGGSEGTVTLWDKRQLTTSSAIHTFQRPGCKFNALDLSEHILAGGASKRIIFWDLRRMKQRCQFTQSFNEDITDICFNPVQPTIFHACALDGLVAKFDLAQKDQEEAFQWGNQINESPRKLQVSGSITLVQTQNQAILRLQDQAIKQRWSLNTPQQPIHILSSYLDSERNVHYYTKNMKNNVVEYWVENHNIGYIPVKSQVELLIPLADRKTIYCDVEGKWFYGKVIKGQSFAKPQQNENFITLQESQLREGHIMKQEVSNKNGFIINKPSSLKQSKKFKPY